MYQTWIALSNQIFFFFKFAEMRWNSFTALEPSIYHVHGRYHIPLLWQSHDFSLCPHQRTGLPRSPYARPPILKFLAEKKICQNRLLVFLLVPPDHDDIS